MNIFIVWIILVCFFVLTLPVGARTMNIEEQVKMITTGVSSVDFDGVPGGLTVYGPYASPMLSDANGIVTAAMVYDGKQKAVIFSHDAWFIKKSWKHPGVYNLIDNSLQWLLSTAESSLQKSGSDRGRILVYRAQDMEELLKIHLAKRNIGSLIFTIESPKVFPDDLGDYSAIITYLPNDTDGDFTSAAILGFKKAFEDGIPVIAAGTGWVYMSYGGGKRGGDLFKDFAGNQIFSGSGVVFEEHYGLAKANVVNSNNLQELIDFVWKTLELEDYQNQPDLPVSLPIRLWQEGKGILDWELALDRNRLHSLLKKLENIAIDLVPTIEKPIPNTDVWRRTAIVFIELVSRRHPEKCSWIYPLIGEFPGLMDSKIELDKTGETLLRQLMINPNKYRWQTLGLWVNAGDKIKVRLRGIKPEHHASLLLGAHTDELILSNLDYWERWPVIHDRFKISKDWQEIHCRKSGPLYVELPDSFVRSSGQRHDSIILEISGTRDMPVWHKGKDIDKFRSEVANSKCPLVEIMGERVIFTQGRLSLPSNFDPKRIMAFWDSAAELAPTLIGKEPHQWAQRFVADRQIRYGYMHSGYPIMTHLDVSTYQMGARMQRCLICVMKIY